MEITQESINAAYAVADDNTKKVLDALFGEQKDNRPITERVNTFEDACDVLGDEHPFVIAFRTIYNVDVLDVEKEKDVIAYLQLRIIVAALNEEWEPTFTEGERRWAPWFEFLTKEELEEKTEEEKKSCRVLGRSHYNAGAGGGLAYSSAAGASSYSSTYVGSRLAFKSELLAEYAGKQFIDIYAEMMGIELKA